MKFKSFEYVGGDGRVRECVRCNHYGEYKEEGRTYRKVVCGFCDEYLRIPVDIYAGGGKYICPKCGAWIDSRRTAVRIKPPPATLPPVRSASTVTSAQGAAAQPVAV